MNKLTNCDKCLSKIIDGKCDCGIWFEKDEHPEIMKNMEKVIDDFNKENGRISSIDHHSGTCMILFKGDYNDCMVVKDYIKRNIL